MTPNDINPSGKLPPHPKTPSRSPLDPDATTLPPLEIRSGIRERDEYGLSDSALLRQPGMITLVVIAITIVGIVAGALFTMAILSGWIEIEPRAIKSALKALFGKGASS